ncbi:DUF2306 domain-containing protein [Dactylosporangium siamense]|uniref:Membrane protein n=1 Tax=Dactylosporangium siamense TaxID=685454 RepID=A0A919PU14_9ACTN|nr:DUF2306 domain-containing protein [Dactylosporangium siamense]GIG50189.1 membrane protein [Dactylosporangium siamense]
MTTPRWLVPTGLILLSLVPMLGGAVRVAELSGGGARTPDNARFFDQPLPVVLHIFSASIFLLLGAFQFDSRLRRRRIGWHRAAGRLLAPLGIVAALTGLWMTVFYDVPPVDATVVAVLRLGFGSAMVVALVVGVAAALRRDIPRHSAWMTRGYAIGLGAGTQAFTLAPWMLLVGEPGWITRSVGMAAGWVINLAVAEWVIRRRAVPVRRPVSTPA